MNVNLDDDPVSVDNENLSASSSSSSQISLQLLFDSLLAELRSHKDRRGSNVNPKSQADVSIFLDNVVDTLKLWSIDIQCELKTLELIDETVLGMHVRSCLEEIMLVVIDREFQFGNGEGQHNQEADTYSTSTDSTIPSEDTPTLTLKALESLWNSVEPIRSYLSNQYGLGPDRGIGSRVLDLRMNRRDTKALQNTVSTATMTTKVENTGGLDGLGSNSVINEPHKLQNISESREVEKDPSGLPL